MNLSVSHAGQSRRKLPVVVLRTAVPDSRNKGLTEVIIDSQTYLETIALYTDVRLLAAMQFGCDVDIKGTDTATENWHTNTHGIS